MRLYSPIAVIFFFNFLNCFAINKDPDLSVPTTCVFAADGSPLEIFAGVMDENDLKKKIKNAAQVSKYSVFRVV